jgi:hypothetical protein
MIYLKTIFYVLLFLLIVNSPIFVSYYDIKYYNLVLIILPIIGIIFFYILFKGIGVKKLNPNLFKLNLNPNYALFIALFCNILILRTFDLNDFIVGNIYEIREENNKFDIDVLGQILPLLLVYPALYVVWQFGKTMPKLNWKFFAILFCLVLYGISSGGRAYVFTTLLLYFFIAKPKILSFKYVPFIASVLILFAFITIGRIDKDLEFDSATYIEASAPIEFNQWLKDEEIDQNARNFVVQTVFYFGHSLPAFCNKVDNLDIELFPRSLLGLQPFVERQFIRIGLLGHDQQQRYLELTGLAKRSGFFESSWSTTFLDVYFQEGVIFSILFFLFIAIVFYQTNLNLVKSKTVKFKVITGFNVVFIISFFLTPIFMDTTWFFTYIVLWFSSNKDLISS